MNRSNWKGDERKIAAAFGTQRTSLSGGNGKISRSDTMHKTLFVECKKRKRHALHSLWRGTNELAKREGKTPVVALRELGSPVTLIVVRLEDLKTVAKECKL